MKKSSYMTRALKASDPRYARVLGKLGYQRGDMQADAPADQGSSEPEDELKAVRDQYETVFNKRPYHGWDIETLKAKIAEAQA